ncbi:hypothetical protein JBL43_04140 [Aureibaculum sp. A20]|uniref:Uncharacterized protein n=1 Tax=Aureibaculum flavum TaxID=2795986 RepID=A0ABS0WN80_9FLAO|nr:hypothetical protein [Aureibaculum flavum]
MNTKLASYGNPDLAMEKACFNNLLFTAINASFLLLSMATTLLNYLFIAYLQKY